MKKLGISLGGGGAKGVSHLAFLKVLDELELTPSIISGTSIGAVAGAFYASGMSGEEIHEKIKGLKFLGLFKFMDLFKFKQSGIFSGDGVEKYLEENLKVKYFEDLQIPLKIVAADFWERKQIVFSKGPLIPALRASISMPGVFSPVKIGKRILIDGSVVNPLPFDIIREECDFVAAIDVSGEKTPKSDNNFAGVIGTLLNTFQIMQTSITAEKIRRNPPEIYIKPRLENFRVLDFDKSEEILLSVSEDVLEFQEKLIEKMF
ncbi:MAG: patatin-like phospholipase family protein [Desulforegulaceae bacterium]|nr:patatin-like phospholipase family protein [Desulforegulaceae bacterium]